MSLGVRQGIVRDYDVFGDRGQGTVVVAGGLQKGLLAGFRAEGLERRGRGWQVFEG